MSCCKEKAVVVNTLEAGTWLQKGREDIHFYSNSLCEGGNGSVIGFNSVDLMEGKIGGTPIALVAANGKIFMQEVDETNTMRHYPVCQDIVYELFKLFLAQVKVLATDKEPIVTASLK